MWFGCDLVLNDLVWFYLGLVRSKWVCFWCGLVSFGVICTFSDANRCYMVWFGCDFILNDLVWFYWGLVRSEWVCFCCSLVSFGVVWCELYIFCANRCFMVWFGCHLGVIWFWMIWCDFIEVWFCLSWFYCVVWCLLVWFGVTCTFSGANRCFMVWYGCDLILNDFVWFYWGLVRFEWVCICCRLVSFGVVWCDLLIFSANRCFMVWLGCDLVLNDLVWFYSGLVKS